MENMSGTSSGAWFSSKEDVHAFPSPGFLQHNSQDFVGESSGPVKNVKEIVKKIVKNFVTCCSLHELQWIKVTNENKNHFGE